MKYLKLFQKDADYQQYINGEGGEIHLPNVSYTLDSNTVYYNPLSTPSGGDLLNGEVGDVVLVDKTTFKKVAVKQSDLNLTDYPSDQYLPIGIVVIPASHDVYGTGECGIMSLMEMDYNNPELGANSYIYIYWGNGKTDLSLPNLDQAPVISSALTSNEIIGVIGKNGYLPSTLFTNYKPSAGNGLDTLASYESYYSLPEYTIPSPYLEDGSRNPSYYCNDGRLVASGSSQVALSANCLSDFDGVGNTAVITAAATAQTDWKTSSTIINSSEIGYYPAACCCYRFNPDGNSSGQWYLPACGEMGYMIARCREIQNSITKVQEIFGGSFGCRLDTKEDPYWTSSESSFKYSTFGQCCVVPYDGRVSTMDMYSYTHVRAFLRA